MWAKKNLPAILIARGEKALDCCDGANWPLRIGSTPCPPHWMGVKGSPILLSPLYRVKRITHKILKLGGSVFNEAPASPAEQVRAGQELRCLLVVVLLGAIF